MAPTPASTPVRVGLRLTTVVLVLNVLFGIFMVVSVIVGVARDGQSLLFGNTVPVAVQISPDALGLLPADLRFSGWLDVTLEVHNPSTKSDVAALRHGVRRRSARHRRAVADARLLAVRRER
ncbi:MAG: hypothetical protein H0T99_01470 [Geodermatophilaceae bacterium]|nr:hypothetical protein [Geodermatophilaceae bacterium]